MKSIITYLLGIIFLLSVGLIGQVSAQCPNDNNVYVDLTPTGPGNTQTTACAWGGDYMTFTACAGAEYTITTCGDTDFDTQLTIYEPDGTTVAGFNDDACGLQSTVTFTATTTGVFNAVLDAFPCATQNTCMTISVTQNTACSGGPCVTPSCTPNPPQGCSNSCALTLQTPPACPSVTPVEDVFCISNVGATFSNPYTYIPNCQGTGVDMPLFSSDIWYSFVATGNVLDIDVTGGIVNPSVGLYTGSSCNALTGIGCANGAAGTVSVTFTLLNPGQTYWIHISGADTTDQGAADLTITSYNDCDNCLLGATLTATPPPVNNTYQAGQTVSFCFNVTDWNPTSVNWIHGVTPTFGAGWDQSTLVPTIPPSCDGQGAWGWYNSVTGGATGTVAGPGFFYETNNGCGPPPSLCDGTDPGDNFGDNCTGVVNFNFCWDITVAGCPPNINGADLGVTVTSWGDGETGSWASLACNSDPDVTFSAIAACCFPPIMDSTDVTCFGACDGTATAVGQGQAPFTYNWSTGGTGPTEIGLCSGTYLVTVTDDAGCVTTGIIQVNEPPPFTVSTTFTNITCNGQTDGTATATVSGGTAPYTYSWNSSPVQNTSTATALPIGNYTVTVTDANGCQIFGTVTITEPAVLTSSGFGTEESCQAGCDGAINLTPLGGTTPYSYSWSNGSTTEDIIDLCAGTYNVTVTDASGCITSVSVTLNPIVDVLAAFTYNGNQCLLGNTYIFTNNGDVPGSCGPACPTYWWDYGDGSTSTGTDLAAANPTYTYAAIGTYTVTQVITDGSGCSDTTTLTLQVLDAPVATVTGVDETCVNACNGTATVSTSGGAPIANYNWSNGGVTQSISGLCAGTYSVTVTDLNGCQDTSSITINSGTDIKAGFTYNGDQCLNGNTYTFTNIGTVPGLCGMNCPTFTWDFGDTFTQSGTTAGDASPTHTYGTPGTYTVTQIVSDGVCADTIIQIIIVYPEPTITIVPVDLSCAGVCDGSADLTVLTGTPPYTYNWTNFETAQDLNGVCAGTYGVTVTDSVGCTVTGTVTINEPPAILITLTATNPSCSGICDGLINSAVSGGSAPYTYQWNDPANQTTSTATGLCADTFMLVVTDANGCSDSDTVSIVTPPLLGATTVGTDATCFGVCDGTASVTASGGTLPYTYNWNDPLFQTTDTATGLCAGTFTVTVTDAGNCDTILTYVVNEPLAMTLTTSSTPATCGNPDGSACVVVSGGTVPFTYSWDDPGLQVTICATTLLAGGYTILVTDANGCTASAPVAVSDVGAPTATISDSADVSCNGGTDGSATVTPSGGTAPYTYSWNSSPIQTDSAATGLPAGTYTATLTDASGCVTSASVTITEPLLLTVSITASTNVSCASACDGTSTASVSGGTAPYTYSWDSSPVQTNSVASGLCTNFYTVSVTDSLGCIATDTITIEEPLPITASIIGTDVLCNLGTDGSANLTATGGTLPFTYLWSNGATSEDIINLAAGIYNVTITDASGCDTIATVTINEPLSITLSTIEVDANCGLADGSSTVSASGGSGSYTYSWDTSPVQTTATATGLSAGTYTATVTDSNGCFATISATILDIPGGTASAVVDNNPTGSGLCDAQATGSITGGTAPFTYLWNDPGAQTTATGTGLCAGTYCVTITDVNGCQDSACVIIVDPPAILLTIIATNNLCFGDCNGAADLTVTGGIPPYTFLWNPLGQTAEDIINLCAGTYTVQVTDSNGIVTTDSVTITEPLAPLAATVAGTDILCNGQTTGAINLTVTGGTALYTYLWAPGGETTEDLSNLASGTYTATVTDANGCTTTASYTVVEPTPILLTSSGINANCGQADGQASVSASGGTSPYAYSWSTSPVQTGNTAIAIPAGSYTVIVTDASGCQDSATVNISDVGGGTATITTDNDASCFGDCNGQANIAIAGGTAPFTYVWDDPAAQTNPIASGLCVGTFNVSATDAVGCLLTGSATILQPTAISVVVTGINANCFGACDGSAVTTVSGGTIPYTYAWNTSPIQVTNNAVGLCAGSYNVTVTDGNGCDTVESVLINEPLAIVVTTTTVTSTCGQANGQATASGTNGTTPYSYVWGNGPITSTNNGLLAGSYTVTITDVNGCTGIGAAAVSDTIGPLVLITDSTNVSCPGGSDGSLTADVADGSPPYTYSWNDPLNQTTLIASGLVEGTYVITVIDSSGCITTATQTISAPPLLVASINSSTNPSCNGICDGTATVSGIGGTSAYTYIWDDPGLQTTSTVTGLCAGVFLVTITDANGCTDTASVTLTEPLPLNVTTTFNPASCAGICDGSISTSVTGGTTAYAYVWNDPSIQTTATASGLCAGSYDVTITDANGCTFISTETVTEPAPLVSTIISVTGVSCNGLCDGSAEIAITGGTLPLTYLWSNGQTIALVTNVCGGPLTVTITDANGCTISDNVIIPAPAPIVNVFTSTNVDCFGNSTGVASANISGGTAPYTYLWDDLSFQTSASATGLIAGTYTVLVTDSSGCTLSDIITITEPVAIAMTLDTTGANCGLSDGSACVTVSAGVAPFSYLWDDLGAQTTACAIGISSGNYNVTVTDNSGCTAIGLVVVNDLGAPTLIISAFADANCNGGCDGFATVQIVNGDPPYTYTWNDPNTQTTANAGGLCAGTYIVNILDSNSCSGSISAIVGEPTSLNVTISGQTPTSCNGLCDATATALGSGGTPPYSYQWNDPGLQTTQTATGLCAGTYGLTLIDANGCTDTTSVTILQPTVIALTTSWVNANCSQSDGSATVSATGGNGLYAYLWDDPSSQITATAINISAGTYTVIVTDILGCTASATVTVNDVPPGVATISTSVNVSCNGGGDGSATVSMAGGTLPFTYLWDDPLGQTTNTATGLGIGLVTITVTDSNGCVVNASTTINEPTMVMVNITGVDVSCKISCDGSATAIANGGTGTYTYAWDDPLAQTNAVALGLCSGTYNVTVTDNNGCINTGAVIIGAPDSIVLSESHSDANCGQSNGIATVTVTGGTGPYTYFWNPGGQTTPFVANLSAGTYFVTVTDANLCVESLPVTISDLNGPSVSISSIGDVNCNGGSNGQATAVVTGGAPAYTYSWNDSLAQATATATNLDAGIYTVTIVDTNGCIASTTTTINEPAPIVFNPASTAPTCFSDCNGTVGVTVTGGTPAYQYLWNDPVAQTNATANGLCAGTYIGIITDSNNCIEIATITILDPQPITSSVSFIDETCFGACNGSVTVTPANGSGTYTYNWDDPFNQATQTASSLCVGTYNVTVTDNNGCTATASSAVSGPIGLTISISSSGDNACFGDCQGFAQTLVVGGSAPFTYLWSDGQTTAQAVSLCAGVFDVSVTDANGCTSQISVTITEPQGMALNVTGNNISCNGQCNGTATASISGGVPPYTYLWSDGLFQTTPIATALCAGFYSVTVTDISGCTQSLNIILTEPQLLTLNTTSTSSTCGFSNGGACVTVIGGASPYVITWNDPNTTVGACVFNVFAGTYNPLVTDANGCTFTMPVLINDIAGPTIDTVTSTDVTCAFDSNGTATVIASGAAPPFTYIWKDNSGNTIDSNVTTTFGLWGGTYSVNVIDANGCIAGALITVSESSPLSSAIISSTLASCNGTCDGIATIMTGGGVAPYSYLWTDGQTTTTAVGLCAGTHSIIVTDNNGCIDINAVTINQPISLVIADSINDVSCSGLADGSIYLNVTGGTPFYIYNWSPSGGGNSSATNLGAQVYNVTVTDINSCVATATMTVNEPTQLAAATISSPSTCGINNGSATVTISGGTAPYTYLWDDPANTTSNSVIDLFPRDPYYATITDANGCMLLVPVTVLDQPGPVIDSISVDNVQCNGDMNAEATVYFINGTSPFTYQWDDPLQQTTITATSLGVGIIEVTVTDNNGCTATAIDVITEPLPITISVSPDVTICYGASTTISAVGSGGTTPYLGFIWSNQFVGNSQPVYPVGTTTYTVVFMDDNGCASPVGSVEVTVKPPISVTIPDITICEGESAVLSATAAGGDEGLYTYTWSNGYTGGPVQSIPGLMDADDPTYSVTVTDACGSVATDVMDVTVNPTPIVSFDSDGSGCFPYVFAAFVSGTATYQSWLWDFGDGATSTEEYATTHAYTDSGQYTVTLTVTSTLGCVGSYTEVDAATVFALPTAEFTMNQNGLPLVPPVISELSPWVNFVNTSLGEIDSVYWNFDDPASGTDNTSDLFDPTHTFSDTGTYNVLLVVVTPQGCIDSIRHVIVVESEFILFAPNAFTPNGDNDNDRFMPKGIGVDQETFELYIYDRWGDLIAKVKGVFGDDLTLGWDGTANGGEKIAQIDVYVWLIRTEDFNGVAHEYVGHVTLLR